MLEIRALTVGYFKDRSLAIAVRNIDLHVADGRATALVGESGSGKSTVALAIMRLINPPIGTILSGSIKLAGQDLLSLHDMDMRKVLHEDIGYIPQDPSAALDPLFTIGTQIDETLSTRVPRVQRPTAIARLLESLGVKDAPKRLGSFPHEFSGGMNQRVAIATALARDPKLIIADEPTTALDVTTQLGILRLLDQKRREFGLSLLFVTHDLSVARALCQEVAVLYAGEIMESGPIDEVVSNPLHPYTRALILAVPNRSAPKARLLSIQGRPSSAAETGIGCPFASRCPLADSKCRNEHPPLNRLGNIMVACWKAGVSAPV